MPVIAIFRSVLASKFDGDAEAGDLTFLSSDTSPSTPDFSGRGNDKFVPVEEVLLVSTFTYALRFY